MRLSFVVIISICLINCSKHEINKNTVLVLGHGGMGFDDLNGYYAPNSVASISTALDFYDLDGVEVDVQFTKDGNLIVFHDDYLENSTQCKGYINSLNFDEIGKCYYRKQYSNNYNEEVISLDSLIILINNHWKHKLFSFDVKDNFDVPYKVDSLAGFLNNKLKKLISMDNIYVECNDANILYALKRRRNYECMLVSSMDSVGVRDVSRFGLDGIVSNFNDVNDKLMKQLLDSSKKIILHGLKNTRDYRSVDYKNIYGVQIDNPIAARKYFKD